MENLNFLKKKAERGRLLWLSLVEKHNIDAATFVILLPTEDRKDNEPALRFLDKFLEQKFAKKAYVLSHDEWVKENITMYSSKGEYVYFSREQARELMQFYCLYEFAPNLVIASLTEPSGRLGEKLVGHKNPPLTRDEIFKTVVYRLWD